MKEIQNKRVMVGNETEELSYANLLLMCIRKQPDGGFTLDDQQKRLRIKKVLDDVLDADAIVLEDADHAVAVRCAKIMTWPILDKEILAFIEALKTAKTVKAK